VRDKRTFFVLFQRAASLTATAKLSFSVLTHTHTHKKHHLCLQTSKWSIAFRFFCSKKLPCVSWPSVSYAMLLCKHPSIHSLNC